MAKFLFEVENRNRLEQKGLLKRFSLTCIGKQLTLEDMRSEKAEKFKELSKQRNTREYEMWFLRYIPSEIHRKKKGVEDVSDVIPMKIKHKQKGKKIKTKKNVTFLNILRNKQKTNKNK
jgi:hypothetical protein